MKKGKEISDGNEPQSLLQGLIDSLRGLIAVLDGEGKILSINRSWREAAAANPASAHKFLPGSNYIEVCRGFAADPESGVQLADGIADVIKGDNSFFEIEYPYQNQNGQRFFKTRVTRFGGEETGEGLRVLVNHIDVSERRLTEIALRESEESYRILAETASDVIIKINSDSTILFINHACERVFGYKAAEMLGQPLTMIMPEDLRGSHLKGFQRYLKTQKRKLDWEGLEVPARHADGHIFPLEISFGEFAQGGRHYFIGVARDISDRKQNEKATARLAAIVESSDDAIISKDLDGIITSWNRGAETIFGYAAEEVVGKPVTILIPPHLSDEEPRILERIRRGEQIEHSETIRRRKDGSDINVSITVSPIRDDAGTVVGASKIARDITERRQTEETLQENQMMLSLAMQSSRMGAWEQDFATGVVIWSEELEEIFGLEKNSFGQTREAFYELIYEDDRRKMNAGVQKAIDEHRDYAIEFRFHHADGSIRWMEGRGQAVYSEKGEAVRLYGIGIDITEGKQAEQALRESEERFRLLTENAEDYAIIFLDTDARITTWNVGAERILGWTEEEAIGQSGHIIFTPEDRAAKVPEKEISAAAEKGHARDEHWHLRKDGSRIFAFGEMVALYDEAENLRGFAKLFRDLTERKRLDDELRQQKRLLEALTESVLDGILIVSPDGRMLHFNQQFLDIWNFPPEVVEAQSDELALRWAAEQTANPAAFIARVTDIYDQPDGHFREEMPMRDGRVYERYGAPILDEGAARLGWVWTFRDITERKRAEEKLRDSENQMRVVTDAMPALISYIDADCRYRFVNRTYTDWFGHTGDEVIGKTMCEILGASAFEVLRPHVEAALAGKTEIFEAAAPYKEGGTRFIRATYTPDVAGDGAIKGFFALVLDITDRRIAEDQLRESRGELERQSRIFDTTLSTINDYVYNFDRDGRFLYANKILLDLWKLTREEAIGKTMADLNYPKEVEIKISEAMRQAFDTGQTVTNETFYTSPDGTSGYFENILSPFFAPDGTVEFVSGSSRDITERKQAQEALIKAERKAAEDYQALLSRIVPLGQTLGTARDLVSIYRAVHGFICSSMNCSGFFVSFYDPKNNLRTAAYVWGEGEEVDISELPPMILTPDSSGGANSQAIFQKKTVITNRLWDKMKNRPHVILRENGVNPMSSIVVPMTVKNEVIGTLEVQAHEDAAFNKEQAIALEMAANLAAVAIENVRLLEVEANARQVAEEANRAKDEFLSVLSHELRTPLNAIFGWTRMLKSGGLDEKLKDQAIETIERNTRLQNNLIEDILDVSRIISGKMRLDCEKIDFVSIVETCVETAKPLAQEKNIELTFQTQTAAQNIFGDATRLQQVINNLLSNAVKFTTEGGRVSVELSRKKESVRLQITDTGIGIAADFLPLIFDRFKQADSTTKRSHSGLGLGLTIVRHLTELHGGRIEVSSAGEDQGSTFVIELPLAKDEIEMYSSAAANGDSPASDSKLKGAKILLVDDDPDGLQPLQILLENQQADVSAVYSAREALQKIADAEKPFDILVSDIGMPEMDGFELIAEARRLTEQKNYSLPAVALTAYASSQDRERVLSSGYQMHLPKPVDFEEFLLTINNLLNDSNKLR